MVLSEETKKKYESIKKPAWTMDVMIFSNLNEIGKNIDDAAFQVEQGDMNAMMKWKASLRQFYRNIQTFFPINDATGPSQETITKMFAFVNTKLNPFTNSYPTEDSELMQVFDILGMLNDALYDYRNRIFVKFVEIVNPVVKETAYAFSGLPDDELQGRVDAAIEREEAKKDGNTTEDDE